MRKVLLSTVFTLVLAGSAIAAPLGNTNTNVNTNRNDNINANLNLNSASADARAGAFAGVVNHTSNKNWQSQGQGQSQRQTSTAKNEGDENDVRVTTAPNLAGLVASPHTCMGSVSVSGGGGGLVSLGVGTTYRDRECDLREAIKLAAQLGLTSEAVALFRQLDAVRGTEPSGVAGTGTRPVQTSEAQDYFTGRESGTRETPVTLVEWFRGVR